MKECPKCRLFLQEIRQLNVTIDACSRCKGIWLDSGELSKIIQVIRDETHPPKTEGHEIHSDHRYIPSGTQDRHEHWIEQSRYHPKKKKSRLSEIFDLFD